MTMWPASDSRAGIGDDTGHDLHDHEHRQQGERGEQATLVARAGPEGGGSVVVVVAHLVRSSRVGPAGPARAWGAAPGPVKDPVLIAKRP